MISPKHRSHTAELRQPSSRCKLRLLACTFENQANQGGNNKRSTELVKQSESERELGPYHDQRAHRDKD